MAVTGVNHITLAVADLDRAIVFYRDVLGCRLRAIWAGGAYLEAGSLWLCLSLGEYVATAPVPDDSHIALSVSKDAHAALHERLVAQCPIWKQNRSEGASTYFLDPDGHKLEIHVGSLESRLDHYRNNPDIGVRLIDDV